MFGQIAEWIESACMGWAAYIDGGKLAALALVTALFLWLGGRVKGAMGLLVRFGAMGMVLCIFPVTAAGLMIYQTRFYDYQWIWSMVPVTALIALGGTVFITTQWEASHSLLKRAIVTVSSVLIVLLCGGLGAERMNPEKTQAQGKDGEAVLARIEAQCGEGVCLWAPAEVLEYARLDGERELFYGRNMWDEALNAYSYDTYSQQHRELYLWMEKLDDWQIDISVEEVLENINKAEALGANCILIPTEMSDWLQEPETESVLLERFAQEDIEVSVIEGYYLLDLR